MIVKVQMSKFSSDGVKRCLIYTKDRAFKYEGGMNDDMVQTMAGRDKAFFEASMGPEGLEIADELPDQGW